MTKPKSPVVAFCINQVGPVASAPDAALLSEQLKISKATIVLHLRGGSATARGLYFDYAIDGIEYNKK